MLDCNAKNLLKYSIQQIFRIFSSYFQKYSS